MFIANSEKWRAIRSEYLLWKRALCTSSRKWREPGVNHTTSFPVVFVVGILAQSFRLFLHHGGNPVRNRIRAPSWFDTSLEADRRQKSNPNFLLLIIISYRKSITVYYIIVYYESTVTKIIILSYYYKYIISILKVLHEPQAAKPALQIQIKTKTQLQNKTGFRLFWHVPHSVPIHATALLGIMERTVSEWGRRSTFPLWYVKRERERSQNVVDDPHFSMIRIVSFLIKHESQPQTQHWLLRKLLDAKKPWTCNQGTKFPFSKHDLVLVCLLVCFGFFLAVVNLLLTKINRMLGLNRLLWMLSGTPLVRVAAESPINRRRDRFLRTPEDR